ncbi:FRIGIDA-like protein 3 isoform X1 [Raphanus sativus]|uniref:FRIGIDA-like protein n=2 Tax=Raphanus sativus TaxID=3726 RepID=A0A9W3CVA4_RAPSA|nr:FRIGIDA-like protein 3 isoform X1 [Raphanus sativus]
MVENEPPHFAVTCLHLLPKEKKDNEDRKCLCVIINHFPFASLRLSFPNFTFLFSRKFLDRSRWIYHLPLLLDLLLSSFKMEDNTRSVASLMDSTSSKIQQLQKAFAELESQRAVTLNLKWNELEEHFHGLERSLKRRFHELEDQEKEYETKTRKAQELLEKKKAAVEAKEKASLERLQKKRDAAVFAINTALDKYNNNNNNVKSTEAFASAADDEDVDGTVQDVVEVKAYPQLVKLCRDMDSAGLHKFVSDNRKNLVLLKEEIPVAFRAAANPASLVLDALEGFYPPPTSDGKKDANLLGMRRTCVMLMECLGVLLYGLDSNSVADVLSEDVKDRAKGVAEGWSPLLESLDMDAAGNGNSLEAHAFLQLLATFGVVSEFEEDEILKLIPMVSRRRQAAELCRSLGLSQKMPGVIEVLVNSGKQIDAVNLAFAFGLTEQFPPVELLKCYLTEASRSTSQGRPGNASPAVQDEFSERELTSLKAVIKCVEEHDLEEQYPVEPLHKRILQLEKAKAEKKRATEPTKPQTKRPRGPQPRATENNNNNNNNSKTGYGRVIPERYPQYVYDNRPFLRGPIMAAQAHPPPQAYSFSPAAAAAHGNFYGNCYQYQAPPPAYFH